MVMRKEKFAPALWVLMVLLIPSLVKVAGADEIKTPTELRFVSPTNATSNCIGDPRTPLCALETFQACTTRLEPELCHRVGIYNYAFQEKQSTVEYYIVSTETKETAINPKNVAYMKKGHVYITTLEPDFKMSHCPDGCKTTYHLKPTEKGWRLVDYAVWRTPINN